MKLHRSCDNSNRRRLGAFIFWQVRIGFARVDRRYTSIGEL